jgi:hypothetical protein
MLMQEELHYIFAVRWLCIVLILFAPTLKGAKIRGFMVILFLVGIMCWGFMVIWLSLLVFLPHPDPLQRRGSQTAEDSVEHCLLVYFWVTKVFKSGDM